MPSLNVPQANFLQLPHKFRAFVAGFGSGKTWAGSAGLMQHFAMFPKVNAGYYAPTYKLVKGVFYPTIEEVAHDWGFKTHVKLGDHEVHLSRGRAHYGVIHCRTMDNPANIVGFKTGHALVDELDIMNTEKAEQAWNKIIARMRYKVDGVKNGVDVTTTPEGFKFTYKKFKKDPTESYGMIQASTYQNEKNLPADYIPTLRETYPEQLIEAYLNGEFVNLTSGTVYNNYSRKDNYTSRKWDGQEPVYIGMDFNVGQMAAVVHVKDPEGPRAVDEICNAYDTPEMIRIIKERYRDCSIRVYPDASGGSRKSVDASITDLALLQAAGFAVVANKRNPFVKDRVLAMNVAFCNNVKNRAYLVNSDMCPSYADCLEQQVWSDNGEPDKKAGNDHMNDAGGYFVAFEYPVNKPAISMPITFSM